MTNNIRSTIWIAVTLVFTLLMCLFQGVSIQWGGAERALAIAALLLAAAYLFRTSRAGTVLRAAGLWTCFVLVFVYALRIVATTARPYADPFLATIDMGVATELYRRAKDFPRVDAILTAIYNSTTVQTEIAIVYLAVTNQKARTDTLLLRFILAALISLIGFYWCPAFGTVHCGLAVPDGYQEILDELTRLRAGVTAIGGPETTALITFPSFHTISAVLLISVYHRSWLFRPMIVLNGLMILSTMTAGMHYAIDVLAGLAVCGAVIGSTRIVLVPAREARPCAELAAACAPGAKGELLPAAATLADVGAGVGCGQPQVAAFVDQAQMPSAILNA